MAGWHVSQLTSYDVGDESIRGLPTALHVCTIILLVCPSNIIPTATRHHIVVIAPICDLFKSGNNHINFQKSGNGLSDHKGLKKYKLHHCVYAIHAPVHYRICEIHTLSGPWLTLRKHVYSNILKISPSK